MGQTVSQGTNAMQSLVDVTLNATTRAVLDCSHTIAQTQEILITDCTNVSIEDVRASQAVEINGACLQDNFFSSENNDLITAAVQQQANAIANSLALSPAEARNVTTMSTHLSSTIQTNFFQTCKKSLVALQGIILNDCANVTVRNVDFTQQLEDTMACAQQNSTNTTESAALVNAVDQTASASDRNKKKWLTTLLVVLGLLAVVGGFALLFRPTSGAAVGVTGGAGGRGRGRVAGYTFGIVLFSTGVALSTACVVGYPVSVFTSTTLFPYDSTIPTLPPGSPDDGSKLYEYQMIANTSNDARNRTVGRKNKTTFYTSLGVDAVCLVALSLLVFYFRRRPSSSSRVVSVEFKS